MKSRSPQAAFLTRSSNLASIRKCKTRTDAPVIDDPLFPEAMASGKRGSVEGKESHTGKYAVFQDKEKTMYQKGIDQS